MYAKVKSWKNENLEVNVFNNEKARSSYNNIITKDPNRIALVLMDMIVLGFPIEKAITIILERIKKHDWMGI